MKKNILFIYSSMMVGGSTTSLLSLLNNIDYERYNIDLQLYDNNGELQSQINNQVNILEPCNKKVKKYKKFINPLFWMELFLARFLSGIKKNRLINAQFMSKYEAMATERLPKEYDVAVSFLEFWPTEYLVRRTNAKKKFSWIHIDIKEGGLLRFASKQLYKKIDKIVLVSDSCKQNFGLMYPEYQQKTYCVENLLSSSLVRSLSQEPTKLALTGSLKFITVCRIVYASKGLDRALKAFYKLKEEGTLSQDVKWYVVGAGLDYEKMEQYIKNNNLEENVILLGEHSNPYCIEKQADIFLLPSRYEGKPMAVTEAHMLGLVPVVCKYSSATEQIRDGIDGIIAENNDEDIYNKLRALLKGEYDIETLRDNVVERDFSNIEEIEKLYKLIEG